MKISLFLLVCFLSQNNICLGQRILSTVMVGDKGITKNAKLAKYLVVVKKYNDTMYERLDYNFAGPMIYRATYKESFLKTLHGPYANFTPSGYLHEEGKYKNNQKQGSWYLYNDSARAMTEHKYRSDSLMAIVDLDSLSVERGKIKVDTTGQIDAIYRGGEYNFIKHIQKNIKIPERTAKVSKGGTTKIHFAIDTLGNTVDIKVAKSVEFAFDEESKRVISLARDWIPASDKGRKLRAFRELPISIKIE